jgi:hypothetical protein
MFHYTPLFHCYFSGAPAAIPFLVWDSIISVVVVGVEEVLRNGDTCYVMLCCWLDTGGVNKFLIWKVVSIRVEVLILHPRSHRRTDPIAACMEFASYQE